MSLATAIFETASWLNHICLVIQSSAKPHRTPWLSSATVQGFDFVPLLSATDILDEARAQNHCADQLGLLIACGHAALFSIRYHSQRIATMQLRISANADAGYEISEIKCRHNAKAPQDIWQAAREFVRADRPCTNDAPTNHAAPAWPLDNEAWSQFIANYRAASASAFPLPEILSFRDYTVLRDSLAQLAAEQGLERLFSSEHGPLHRP